MRRYLDVRHPRVKSLRCRLWGHQFQIRQGYGVYCKRCGQIVD